MSALPSQAEVRQVHSLAAELPFWPHPAEGRTWALVPPPVLGRSPVPSTMRAGDLTGWTPAGLEQLARALREGIRRAKGGAR